MCPRNLEKLLTRGEMLTASLIRMEQYPRHERQVGTMEAQWEVEGMVLLSVARRCNHIVAYHRNVKADRSLVFFL